MRKPDEHLTQALGYSFQNPALLEEALTHSSTLQGRRAAHPVSYERLEFLGDRVLGLIIAEMLYHAFEDEAEGALARRHTGLVRREALARVAQQIDLARHLILARGEEEAGGRENITTLADSCEALIGAIYLDGGIAAAEKFVHRYWRPLMGEDIAPPKDAKTSLQEWAQARAKKLPEYKTLGMEGPPHDPVFSVEVSVEGYAPVTARGGTKRAAEQAAAAAMLQEVMSE